jgi:hypothetical protein
MSLTIPIGVSNPAFISRRQIWKFSLALVITPILHCKAKTATQLIFVTVGKSGFDFYMCKIKVSTNQAA